MYKFFRGTNIGSSRDCSDQCLRDLNCYAFNYAKLTKWCFLGYTHQRYLRSVENAKMESGYRQCSTHSTDDGWTSEVFTVAGAPSSVVATAKTDTSMIMTYIDGATGNPVETYSAKCVAYGLGCSSPAIGISLSYPRATQSIPVSGLTASTRYYCYVVVTNTVRTVCSPALTLTTCAAGMARYLSFKVCSLLLNSNFLMHS